MSAASRTPSLTPSPSRSPTPAPPVQPDHFYGAENVQLPPSPDSNGKTWLDPDEDPLAHRGIPVFKPTMEEFEDFEAYMNRVECWGMKSGIVKVIPPKEWVDALPSYKEQLASVKIKAPIEQQMRGRGGLFRQENIERRRNMSVREWAELCGRDDLRAPGVNEIGLHARAANAKLKTRKGRKKSVGAEKAETAEPEPREDDHDHDMDECLPTNIVSPPDSTSAPADNNSAPATPVSAAIEEHADEDPAIEDDEKLKQEETAKGKAKRAGQSRGAREASLAERAARDAAFLETFKAQSDWLPPNTSATDYTPEFCQKLERQYWRNCGLGKSAWYGADTLGSLYTDDIKSWNVANLSSTLSRILPSAKGLPGVNTPYLYFGMWRATFAWHVEDMDLFSINYIHFGAPKFWYAIPQGRAGAMENTMRGYFPKDTSQCPQFLRHKSFLASPTILAQSACRPNTLVQHAGEFVITYPRGYHAGFNLGFNCAESVNFALDSWLDLGRKAKACECIPDSVRIDVDQLLADRAAERAAGKPKPRRSAKSSDGTSRKRKAEGSSGPKAKKAKTIPEPGKPSGSKSVKLKLGPKPPPDLPFPCCLCVSMHTDDLLRVMYPPVGLKDSGEGSTMKLWQAHESCARVVPDTWVDEVDSPTPDHPAHTEKVVFGVDVIGRDRWNLKCCVCTKSRQKAHGAPIQCSKGKCPKAFHVSCARNGADSGIVYNVLQEIEKEVILVNPSSDVKPAVHDAMPEDHDQPPDAAEPMQIDRAEPSPTVDSGGVPSPPEGIPPMHHASIPDEPHIVKTIRKLEVHVLCSQHNPATAAAKKANKQDKIRLGLMALPPMSRIKIRVSSGVFEVSLLRVIEGTGSVEVLWDRGIKREFKWGSVVFGNTEGQTVLQKPSEPAPEAEQSSSSRAPSHSVSSLPSTTEATSRSSAAPSQLPPPPSRSSYVPPTQRPAQYSLYPQQQSGYAGNSWPYQYQQNQPPPPRHGQPAYSSSQYSYGDYYQGNPPPHGTPQYQQYSGYNYSGPQSNSYRQIQWQRPYVRPRDEVPLAPRPPQQEHYPMQPQQSAMGSLQRAGYDSRPHSRVATPHGDAYPASLSNPQSDSGSRPASTPLTMQGVQPPANYYGASPYAIQHAPTPPSEPPRFSAKDISALSSLQPSQIESILRHNADLRHVVQTAIDIQKTS